MKLGGKSGQQQATASKDNYSSWQVVSLAEVTRECRSRNNGQLDDKLLCGVLKSHGLVPMRERVKGDSTDRCKVVAPNAFAYNPMRLNIGSIARNTADRRVMVSPDYVVFQTDPERLLPNYLDHVRYSGLWKSYVGATGDGSVRVRIYYDQLSNFQLPLPPLPEQQKIAAILTAVDDKLDVIARQIETTQTLKKGLMQTLFSRGVGTQDATGRWIAHTEFQDSELGAIPKGWAVQPLDTLAESITVGIATSTTEHYVEDGVPLIRNQNIKEDFLDMSDLLKISVEFDETNKRKRVLEGDILTVRTGYPGVSCVVPRGLGYLQTFTTLITRPNQKLIYPSFASRYFNSPRGKGLMLHQAAGGAQKNINAGNLKKLLVPVPPLIEQERIAEILAAVDQKRRSLEAKNEHYRSIKHGLMQKLLTGEWRVKLDSPTGSA